MSGKDGRNNHSVGCSPLCGGWRWVIPAGVCRPAYWLIVSALLLLVAIPPDALAAENGGSKTGPDTHWIKIADKFFQQIGANDITTVYLRNCQGLIVTPTGELVMQTATKGICVSTDQGASWSVVEDNNIEGRSEMGFDDFSLAYPYDGRMAIFCYDGDGSLSGGISLDGAKTWRAFAQILRGVENADIDWQAHDPQTIFGVTHEPYLTVLSVNGGRSWQRLHKTTEASIQANFPYRPGVIKGQTLTRYNAQQGGIELSSDAGRSWTLVTKDYKVTGGHPVHYGKKIYWTTTKGVIVTTDGKKWTLTGAGAEDASYGPYFGASEKEFVVVTSSAFLKTEDGGKTWRKLADFFAAPDVFHHWIGTSFFGWDATHHLLYSSGLGASVYQLDVSGR